MKKVYYILTGALLFSGYALNAQPTVPANPATGNAANCTVLGPGNTPIDQCVAGSTVFVTNFTGGTYNRGNNGNNLGVGAIWRFANIGTVGGVQINVEVTINSQFQADVTSMDNNAALDQAGNSVADFFAPTIRPDVNLNATDRRGYVQMTMNFFQGVNNFTTPVSISSLNMISYDADGSFEAGGATSQAWLRETRVAQVFGGGNPIVLAAGTTELVAYNYADGGNTWTGFAGGVYERTGISRCAQVASSFRYNSVGVSSVTFRLGYDFKAGTNGYNVGRPGREYGIKFGCYAFPSQSTLPVSLLSFSASLKNNTTSINWETENESEFSHFEVERKDGSGSFTAIGSKNANNSAARSNYQYSDNIAAASGDVFFYRLKMVDLNGRFKYSNEVLVRKGAKSLTGISMNPNPIVIGGVANVRFEAARPAIVTIRVLDLAGRTVLQQQSKAAEGTNTVAINNLERLQTGSYIIQLSNGDELTAAKFSVVR